MTPPPSDDECRQALRNVYAYLDGELPAHQQIDIRTHLRICRQCLKVFRLERQFLRRLQTLPEEASSQPAAKKLHVWARKEVLSR